MFLSSDFLGEKKWNKLENIFDYLEFDEKSKIANIGFELSSYFIGEVFGFSSGLGKKLIIGEFSFTEDGNIGFVQSFYKDNFDVLTSMTNIVYMISNQAKRKNIIVSEKQENSVSREEKQKQLEEVFSK